MTVAAAEAVALRDCLAARRSATSPAASSAPPRAPIDHAWQLSVGADLALPEVEGRRPAARAAHQRLSAPPARHGRARPRRCRRPRRGDRHARTPTATCCAPRSPPASPRGPRAVAWSEQVEGVRRRELRVGELRTPLREAGPPDAREAVVFLHGNPGSSADWEPLLAAVGPPLARGGLGRPRVRARRRPAEFPQTVEAHAQFVGRALDALGIERVHLVAHDFGGPWGLAWAAGEPDRFASAVLLGTGALPGYRWHALARLWRTPHAASWSWPPRPALGFRLAAAARQPARAAAAVRRPHVRRLRPRHPSRRARALPLRAPTWRAAGERLAQALRPLDRPALVLWGRHDPYIPGHQSPNASARRSRTRRSACSSAAATGPSSTTPPPSPPR